MNTTVYSNSENPAPFIYLNVFEGNGEDVWEELNKLTIPPVNLVVMSGLDWDEQLSPWAAPPVFKQDNFTGGADEYLSYITGELIPQTEAGKTVLWRGIAGYSMAGLFAVYAAYKSEVFECIMSASGSLWFPEFTDFMQNEEIKSDLKYAYFSLGDKEHRTQNRLMRQVKEKTLDVQQILNGKGIRTTFEENPGNHFSNPAWRTAKGIKQMLEAH